MSTRMVSPPTAGELFGVGTVQIHLRADSLEVRGGTSRDPALLAGPGDTRLQGPVITVEKR